MSAVWESFTLETPQSKTAKCNVCKAVIQRGTSSLVTYITTNTIQHLKKHHVKEHKKFLAIGQRDDRSHQESLLESFQKQGKLPANNVKAKGITEKLLNFIILDDQLLSVAENTGFAA